MSRITGGPRVRSSDRSGYSPNRRTQGATGSNKSAPSSLAHQQQVAAQPETAAEMSERLRGERQQALVELQSHEDRHMTAEMIGFSLAKEIGERACDLYINETYDALANEYTALALWDEMMGSIGAFSGAIAAELPKNCLEREDAVPNLPPPGMIEPTPVAPPTESPSPARHEGAPKVRRVRLAEPPSESSPTDEGNNHSKPPSSSDEKSGTAAASSAISSGGGGGGGSGSSLKRPASPERILSAREQLAAAVQAKIKEEEGGSAGAASSAASQKKPEATFDMGAPPENDPSWASDAPPPSMFCDHTARHAALLKLKLVERPTSSDLGDTMSTTSRHRATMSGRRTMISGGRPSSGTMVGGGRPSSGTVVGGGSTTTRPLSPTMMGLMEASKDTVPIHILTHHLSMMASSSPYVPKKHSPSLQFQNREPDLTDGAPEDVDFGAPKLPSLLQRSPNEDGGEGGDKPFYSSGEGGAGGDKPFSTSMPEAGETQSSGSFESFEEEDSVQSPSEIEVAQRMQQKQAQRTRNATAYNTITTQLTEPQKPTVSSSASGVIPSATSASAAAGGGADKNFVVDARLGRVINVTSVEAGGGKKSGSRVNPLTEAPRFQVQLPPPPPEPQEQAGHSSRYARRVAPPPRPQAATTTEGGVSASVEQQAPPQQQQQQQQRPQVSSPPKKTRRRENDPANFFQPEARIAPMVQLMNASGGVVVKDDHGSRRNERPNIATKMSRADYTKLLRVAPSVTAANASDFGWKNNSGSGDGDPTGSGGGMKSGGGSGAAPQTARSAATATGAAGSPLNMQKSVADSQPKTARAK